MASDDHREHEHDKHDDHDHGHGQEKSDPHAGHNHGPPPKGGGRAFAIATSLNLAYVVIEIVFGLIAHSTALLADAAHNMGDVLGLLMAWGAAALAARAPSSRRTYGFRSMTMLAALANSLLILLAAGGVGWEAISRARSTEAVEGGTVALVAIVGVGINIVSALMFARGRGRDVNMRAAFVHLMADAAVGVGVAIAGVLVMATGKVWIDPIASLVVTVVILLGTVRLLRETFNLALAGVPAHIDLEKVRTYLAALPTVCEVHDLHVWPMSTTEVALTVHLRVPWPAAPPSFLGSLGRDLEHEFGIHHVTVQLEDLAAGGCAQAPAAAV
jgi:cobalt-zinc-cadmium efflux system protein